MGVCCLLDVTFEFDEADLVEEYYQLLKDDLKQTIRDNEPPALVAPRSHRESMFSKFGRRPHESAATESAASGAGWSSSSSSGWSTTNSAADEQVLRFRTARENLQRSGRHREKLFDEEAWWSSTPGIDDLLKELRKSQAALAASVHAETEFRAVTDLITALKNSLLPHKVCQKLGLRALKDFLKEVQALRAAEAAGRTSSDEEAAAVAEDIARQQESASRLRPASGSDARAP